MRLSWTSSFVKKYLLFDSLKYGEESSVQLKELQQMHA